MKCWKCGNDNPAGTQNCLYCQNSMKRQPAETPIGQAMRSIYDDYGSETVLKTGTYLVNGLGYLCQEDCSKFRSRLKLAMDNKIGELYLSQLKNPESHFEFEWKVWKILSLDVGLNDEDSIDLMDAFSEMIGWPGYGIICNK